jgi:hypothetical protein
MFDKMQQRDVYEEEERESLRKEKRHVSVPEPMT